jgi:hypothetical protein
MGLTGSLASGVVSHPLKNVFRCDSSATAGVCALLLPPQYSTIKMPTWDGAEVLTYSSLYKIWQLSGGQNFISMPTSLVAGPTQRAFYT